MNDRDTIELMDFILHRFAGVKIELKLLENAMHDWREIKRKNDNDMWPQDEIKSKDLTLDPGVN